MNALQGLAGQTRVTGLTGYPSEAGAAVQETLLTSMLNQIAHHNESMASVCGRLEMMKDRVFGPEPSNAGKGGEPPAPQGTSYAASMLLGQADELLARLNRAVNDLERIA